MHGNLDNSETAEPGVRERIGEWIGGAWAPAVAALAKAREARMFHPEGLVFTGTVEPRSGAYDEIARRLGRRVLARFSPALWRNGSEYLDVLGIGLRFHHAAEPTPLAQPDDQDLLFATIRSPLTMLLSPLFTNAHDFLGNTYWAVAPFAPEAIDHRVELRLVPLERPETTGTRAERLRAAVRAGRCDFALEARRTLRLRWQTFATVSLEKPSEIDQAALRFDPFASGAGIRPVGLVHAIRHAAYAASQRSRPAWSGAR